MSPNEGCGATAGVGVGRLRAARVLIAVHPPAFERLIGHLLSGQAGLRVLGGPARRGRTAAGSSADRAARLAPDLIIASTRLRGREPGDVVADLKRSSPAATLILLTDGLGEPAPHPGADACLPEDAVVRRLLATIHEVVGRAQGHAPQPATAGRRA